MAPSQLKERCVTVTVARWYPPTFAARQVFHHLPLITRTVYPNVIQSVQNTPWYWCANEREDAAKGAIFETICLQPV